MAVIVKFKDWTDVSHIVNCLLAVADTRGPEGRLLAGRLRRIAESLADGLDDCGVGQPLPPSWPEDWKPSVQYTALAKALDEAGYNLVDDRALDRV